MQQSTLSGMHQNQTVGPMHLILKNADGSNRQIPLGAIPVSNDMDSSSEASSSTLSMIASVGKQPTNGDRLEEAEPRGTPPQPSQMEETIESFIQHSERPFKTKPAIALFNPVKVGPSDIAVAAEAIQQNGKQNTLFNLSVVILVFN